MLACKIKKKLGGFSLDVDITACSDITALMGASGSGKSMTLRCIAGISKPDEGKIVLGGVTLFDSEKGINLPPQKRNTGFLFQDYALFPNMTVLKNIMAGAKISPHRECRRVAIELAETFHIAKHLNKYPHQLSGGEKQRCALARILMGSPDILMLDEPFSALDSHLRWELELELASVMKQFAGPVLYVSHNRDEVYRLCDHIVVMNNGRSEVTGQKWEIFKKPLTVGAARLTGCKNITETAVRHGRLIAPGWGIEFDCDGVDSGGVQYIGIRANYIIPACRAPEGEIAAAFPFEIISEIEDTFSNILMVRKKGSGLLPLRWEMPKKDRAALRDMPQELAFLREHVLLLRE